jgi:WD40 repeat protein
MKPTSRWLTAVLAQLVLMLCLTDSYSQVKRQSRPELLLRNAYLGMVASLAFSPDGRYIATAVTEEGWVAIWDARTGFRLRVIQAYTENSTEKYAQSVSCIVYSPDGHLLATSGATADRRASVKFWDSQSGRLVRELKGAQGHIAFSHDGKTLATEFEKSRESRGPLLKLWDVDSGRAKLSIAGTESHIEALTFDPPGGVLVAATDEQIVLFDPSTGNRREVVSKKGFTKRLVFDGNGDLLAILENTKAETVVLSNISRKELIFQTTLKGSFILDATLSPDKSLIAVADSQDMSVKIWEVGTGKLLNVMKGHTAGPFVYAMAFSPDGKTLASGSGDDESRGEVKVWDVRAGKQFLTLGTPGYAVSSILFSPDNRFFAALSNGAIRIWDTRTGDLVHTTAMSTGGHTALSFSPDSRLLVAGNVDGSIRAWDVLSGELRRSWKAHSVGYVTIDFSHNGRWLVSGGSDKSIKVWDAKTWKEYKTLPPQSEVIVNVAFSPDDKLLASACSDDETITLWRTSSWTTLRKVGERAINGVWVTNIEFSPDGRVIAVGKNVFPGLWDTRTGRKIHDFSGGGEAVSFSRDGRRVSIGGSQTKLRIMGTLSGKEVKALRGHDGPLRAVTFSRSGKLVVSGSDDGTARIWDLATGTLLVTILVPVPGSGWLVVTPDGLFDGTSEAMSLVTWRSTVDLQTFPVDAFFTDFYHPGLLAEIMEGGTPKAKMDIATVLQLPGLRAMLSQGSAHIDKRNGKSLLCFTEKPTVAPQVFSDAQPLAFDVNDLICEGEIDCLCHKELPTGTQLDVITTPFALKSEWPKLNYDGSKSTTHTSTLHVQMIGVGNYSFRESGFRQLPVAVAGAQEIEKFFAQQQSRESKSFRAIRVWNGLYDAAATRDAIRRRLAAIANEVEEDDVVFLFFSGHGIVPAGQEMFYFAPVDMRGPNPQTREKAGSTPRCSRKRFGKCPLEG